MEEREINLIDMLAEMLKHWKGVVLFFLIGTVTVAIYGYVKNVNVVYEEEIAVAAPQQQEMTYAKKKAVEIALEYEKLYVKADKSGDVANVISLNELVLEAVKSFDEMQLTYFTENSISNLWKESAMEAENSPQLTSSTSSVGVSMKTIIIWGMVFSLLYSMFWAARYILDGHLKVSDDMMSLVKISQLGVLCTVVAPKFFIDKWIYNIKHHGKKVLDVDKASEIIASNIAVNALKKDVTAVTIVGTSLEEVEVDLSSRIAEILNSKYLFNVNTIGDIIYNEESITALSGVENVVIFEKAGNTTYADLYKEVQLIKQLEIPILGGVIVE